MSALFSSARIDWATPDALYERLNNIYNFNLDVAASAENARCPAYFDESSDGLAQTWAASRVWCNPPYGRSIAKWIEKASAESTSAVLIVMLVPARTDTQWWTYATKRAVYRARPEFLEGRLKFGGGKSTAPFPSALLYWNC